MTVVRIERVDSRNIEDVSKLHIQAERQTFEHSDPQMLTNVSDLAGRRHLWRCGLSQSMFVAFVMYVREQSAPVGMISGRMAQASEGGASHAVLTAIYVLNEFQRLGHGRRLLLTFAKAALHREATEIRGAVPMTSLSGRNFVASLAGFEQRIHTVKRGDRSDAFQSVAFTWNNIPSLLSLLD